MHRRVKLTHFFCSQIAFINHCQFFESANKNVRIEFLPSSKCVLIRESALIAWKWLWNLMTNANTTSGWGWFMSGVASPFRDETFQFLKFMFIPLRAENFTFDISWSISGAKRNQFFWLRASVNSPRREMNCEWQRKQSIFMILSWFINSLFLLVDLHEFCSRDA